MRVLIQKVKRGSVKIDDEIISNIKAGFVILLGIYKTDNKSNIDKLIPKILNLRIMDDEQGVMNKSIIETKGEILVVSQFTLCADTRKGRRPSYIDAMKPDKAEKLYKVFVNKLNDSGLKIQTGKFGALMEVEIINDGPATILLDS